MTARGPGQRDRGRDEEAPEPEIALKLRDASGSTGDSPATGIAAIAVPKIIPFARLVAPRSAKKTCNQKGAAAKKRAGETLRDASQGGVPELQPHEHREHRGDDEREEDVGLGVARVRVDLVHRRVDDARRRGPRRGRRGGLPMPATSSTIGTATSTAAKRATASLLDEPAIA